LLMIVIAAHWNFANFQSPTYSAVMMEYTTPPSYGSTVVRVGGVATDGKLLFAGCTGAATHTEVKDDPENEWPEPSATNYHWEGKTADGKEARADLGGSLGTRLDRVDVMAEVPGFVKAIIASAAGTKPYIYQFAPKLTLDLDIGEEEIKEDGAMFTEATFIS
jgi:Svf1-like C-terminal lipocalin-like domain